MRPSRRRRPWPWCSLPPMGSGATPSPSSGTGSKLHGLNVSGRAPKGPHVPSVCPEAGQRDAQRRLACGDGARGRLRMGGAPSSGSGHASGAAFGPATEYAEQGYPMQPIVSLPLERTLKNVRVEDRVRGFPAGVFAPGPGPSGRRDVAGSSWARTCASSVSRGAKPFTGANWRKPWPATRHDRRLFDHRGSRRPTSRSGWSPFRPNIEDTDCGKSPPNGQGIVAAHGLKHP